jgi:hypothetical protein
MASKMCEDKATKDIITRVIDHLTRRIVPFCDKLTRLYALCLSSHNENCNVAKSGSNRSCVCRHRI